MICQYNDRYSTFGVSLTDAYFYILKITFPEEF